MSQSIEEVIARKENLLGHKDLGPRARRLSVIEIWEDPDANESGQQTYVSGPEYQRIIIAPKEFETKKVPAYLTKSEILAHELGHAIGHIFNLPGQMNDPRRDHLETSLAKFFGMPEHWREPLLAAETEAWDLAEKMVPVKRESREWALDTYRRANLVSIGKLMMMCRR